MSTDMTGTIANQMLDTIINAAAGEQAETISKYLDDEEPANEEDDDSICIWNNFSAGINTIAGILVGNLSQYIAEKYGKGMSTDNISEFVHNLSNVILEIMESTAAPLAKQLICEAVENIEDDTEEAELVSAPVIDISEKIKK